MTVNPRKEQYDDDDDTNPPERTHTPNYTTPQPKQHTTGGGEAPTNPNRTTPHHRRGDGVITNHCGAGGVKH